MESLNSYPLPKKDKIQNGFSATGLGKNLRKYLPDLERFIVRKTLADRRKAMFGKDPFLG